MVSLSGWFLTGAGALVLVLGTWALGNWLNFRANAKTRDEVHKTNIILAEILTELRRQNEK